MRIKPASEQTAARIRLFDMAADIIRHPKFHSSRGLTIQQKWQEVSANAPGVQPDDIARVFLDGNSDTFYRNDRDAWVDFNIMVRFIDHYKRYIGSESLELNKLLQTALERQADFNDYSQFTALLFVLVLTEVLKEMFTQALADADEGEVTRA